MKTVVVFLLVCLTVFSDVKILRHKADTLEIMQSVLQTKSHDGIEVDLYIKNGRLYIGHDQRGDKLFSEVLNSLSTITYLDIKNLTLFNAKTFAKELCGIDPKYYQILYVESSNIKALALFNYYCHNSRRIIPIAWLGGAYFTYEWLRPIYHSFLEVSHINMVSFAYSKKHMAVIAEEKSIKNAATWTVNDPNTFVYNKKIKVVLTNLKTKEAFRRVIK